MSVDKITKLSPLKIELNFFRATFDSNIDKITLHLGIQICTNNNQGPN